MVEVVMSTPFRTAVQRARAELDTKIAELCASNPTMVVREMATILGVGVSTVQDSFRRQDISRSHLTGRPKKVTLG
jgi:transposase